MKKSIILVALICLAIFRSKEAMAIELDTVWVSDISGQVLFQHPVTKNILVATNGGITELNSQDGKFVRSFPFDVTNAELSPDGTKILHSFSENIYIYDYAQTKPIDQIDFVMYGKFLTNDIVICRDRITSNIIKYNLNTKEKVEFDPPHPVTALATSPNGKYIAYATFEEITDTESKAHLYLLDAETMQGLGELGSWDSDWQKIESISFSPNSKYLTFTRGSSFSIKICIFNIENNNSKLELSAGINSVYFLNNKYYVKNGIFPNPNINCQILEFNTNKVIFENYDYIFNTLGNEQNNIFFCNTYAYKTFCFDLDKIISGVLPINPITLKYSNKALLINCYDKPINQITIMTIEGREVFKQNNERLTFDNNEIEIPLELSNGSYIINLVSDKETYTEKIIIVE